VPLRYNGSLEELKALIASAGVYGTWQDESSDKVSFRSDDGAVLNWWPRRSTVNVQGKPEAQAVLTSLFSGGGISSRILAPAAPAAAKPSEQIFIVHGHDSTARDQLELALHRLQLEPFVLMNSSGGGKTLIEALEGKIGRDYSTDFGLVLMTPDDVGYAKANGPEKAEPRARQNVILETGMLLSSLTRERMAIIVKGHLEIPSDLQGIITFRYNEHIKEIVPKLCQRLKEAGFELEPSHIAAAAQ